jgi:replicative DNA helicase
MNPRLVILRLLFDKEIWSEYRDFIKPDDDKHIKRLYSILDDLINKKGSSVSLDEFKAAVAMSIDSERDKDKELYVAYLDLLTKADISDSVIHDFLVRIKQRDIAEKLANVSFEFLEGNKKMEDISGVYHQFSDIETQLKEVEFVTDDLNVLYNETIQTPGLRWRLNSLNRMLGSLRKGDFGFIFARPETGKTTFLASEVTHFAGQTDKPVLWFNNEEQGNKVKFRCYQAALGLKLPELFEDRDRVQREYLEVTRGNIRIFDDASIYRRQVEDICERYSPGLVIFDQIDKLKGFTGDREDLKLGAIYQWAREIAKKHCPVIGVCQADGTADGAKWLTMAHVASAKTSKQAEADFIIGIGKTNADGMEYVRHVNISKNKLQGDEDSDPEQRHGKTDIIIEPQIARYRDVGVSNA